MYLQANLLGRALFRLHLHGEDTTELQKHVCHEVGRNIASQPPHMWSEWCDTTLNGLRSAGVIAERVPNRPTMLRIVGFTRPPYTPAERIDQLWREIAYEAPLTNPHASAIHHLDAAARALRGANEENLAA